MFCEDQQIKGVIIKFYDWHLIVVCAINFIYVMVVFNQ